MRGILVAVLLMAMPVPALAVFSGDMSARARSGDSDYADGREAWERSDWQGVIVAMEKVVARRPWHDNAHTHLGHAYRMIGDYDHSILHYQLALDHHPRNRRALAYLGQAWLDLGRRDMADETLGRLAEACNFVALSFSDGDFSDGCDEWRELKTGMDTFDAGEWERRAKLW